MHIPFDKVLTTILPAKIGATKKVSGAETYVRLGATELAALSATDLNFVYYGKIICVGLTQAFAAQYNSTTEWTSASGKDATGGLVGTFYDVLFNHITSTSPTDGTIYFVGVKIGIANV